MNNKNKNNEDILKQGSALYAKYGCMTCHSIDGKALYGPPLNGIFMTEIKVLRDDRELTLVANREYIRKAIKEPRYEKLLEYKNKDMPLTFLEDDEVDILVDYIIALSETEQDSNKLEK